MKRRNGRMRQERLRRKKRKVQVGMKKEKERKGWRMLRGKRDSVKNREDEKGKGE